MVLKRRSLWTVNDLKEFVWLCDRHTNRIYLPVTQKLCSVVDPLVGRQRRAVLDLILLVWLGKPRQFDLRDLNG